MAALEITNSVAPHTIACSKNMAVKPRLTTSMRSKEVNFSQSPFPFDLIFVTSCLVVGTSGISPMAR